MRYTLFLGCNIPARVAQYHDAAKAVCTQLDINLTEVRAFECCGYSFRNINEFSFLLASARNLALAKKQGNDLMVLCKCCFGSLKTAQYILGENPQICDKINRILGPQGIVYSHDISIRHFLSVLHKDVGPDILTSHIRTRYDGLKIAASVGCHALRPAGVTGFDTPVRPTLFDDLVNVTGAEAVTWSKQSECCGAPLLGISDEVSYRIMETKLSDALQNKADFIAVACPYSFLQFDRFQTQIARQKEQWQFLAPVLYPQLLGLAMGIDKTRLGFSRNMADIDSLADYLIRETTHA